MGMLLSLFGRNVCPPEPVITIELEIYDLNQAYYDSLFRVSPKNLEGECFNEHVCVY